MQFTHISIIIIQVFLHV